jgi:hypothetical protein
MNSNATLVARVIADAIVTRFKQDHNLQARVMESNEPYRAAAWECGLRALDGTEMWCEIMDHMDGRL